MYIYMQVLEKKEYYTDTPKANFSKVKLRLEKVTGERCLIAPFEEVNMQVIKELNPRAVVISGFGQKTKTFEVSSFYGLDEIHACIADDKKLSFRYFTYDVKKKKSYLKKTF